MSRVVVYAAILTVLVLSALVPVARSEGEKYYVYEFSAQTFENGKPSLNYSVTVKFVEVNETAYRVEVLKYSGPEFFEREIEVWIDTLENLTRGLVLVRKGFLSTDVAMQFLYTLWIEPGKLEAGKEATSKLMDAAEKLCSMNRRDYAGRRELVRELYEEEGVRVLDRVFNSLLSGMLARDLIAAGTSKETEYICNGGLTISADELEDMYLFKLTISRRFSSSEGVRSIEARYAKSGWLISSTSTIDAKGKNADGSWYTRKVVETAKLVDTNDEAVKTIMEKAASMEGSTGSGSSALSVPLPIETVGIAIGAIAVLTLIVITLKNYRID